MSVVICSDFYSWRAIAQALIPETSYLPLLDDVDISSIPALEPDYRRSPREVFVDLALFLLEECGPEVLREATSTPRREVNVSACGLPSWAPYWTSKVAPKVIQLHSAGGEPVEKVTRAEEDVSTEDTTLPKRIRLKGIHIGYLACLSDECDIEKDVFPFSQWRNIAFHSERRVSTTSSGCSGGVGPASPADTTATTATDEQERIEAAFCSTVTCAGNDRLRSVFDLFSKFIMEWEKEKGGSEAMPFGEIFVGLGPMFTITMLVEHCDQRKFTILSNGMMALVPASAELSDVVYVLPGATVPFVFRGEGDNLRLIGECYVNGIMKGKRGRGLRFLIWRNWCLCRMKVQWISLEDAVLRDAA